MDKIQISRIDEDGFYLEPVLYNSREEFERQAYDSLIDETGEETKFLKSDLVVDEVPEGLHKPKWIGSEWVEGKSVDAILQQYKDSKIAELSSKCHEQIISGFASSALGVEHIYPSDKEAQGNLQGAILDSVIDPSVTTVNFKTVDSGYLVHTVDQIKQVGKDWKNHLETSLSKYNQMKYEIKSELTDSVEKVDSFIW